MSNNLSFEDEPFNNKPSIKVWVTPTSSKFKKDLEMTNADDFARAISGVSKVEFMDLANNLNNDLEKEVNYRPMNRLRIPIKQMHPIEFLKRATSPTKFVKSKPKFGHLLNKTFHKQKVQSPNRSERQTIPIKVSQLKSVNRKQEGFNDLFEAPLKLHNISHQLSVGIPDEIHNSNEWSVDNFMFESNHLYWQPKLKY